jgi:hypothetical protein
MNYTVEPLAGHPLDRLITALLNATGVVKRVIDATELPPEAEGEPVIGLVAERLRGALALLAEQRSDQDLTLATEVLAETTLLVGCHLGLGELFVHD